ncbi:MAG: hypothetical protein II453_01870 [Alphaproteobacteria bacterium]|jgi:hypothetical protein|nr:hypothetical protein [Alphaproteobacteria bacterium]
MIVRLTIKDATGNMNTVTKTIEDDKHGDFYTKVAERCGWTDKQKEKIDDPLWFLSLNGIVCVEKI